MPLKDLTRTREQLTWFRGSERTFTTVKEVFLRDPVLQAPLFNSPFYLKEDTSDRGMAAVLLQASQESGQLYQVA